MHNPPHPGLTIRDDILPELNVSVSAAAECLGLHRTTFSRVINGRASITVSYTHLTLPTILRV